MFGGMRKTRWRLLAAIGLVAAGSVTGWQIATRATNRNGPSANAIMVILQDCTQEPVREKPNRSGGRTVRPALRGVPSLETPSARPFVQAACD